MSNPTEIIVSKPPKFYVRPKEHYFSQQGKKLVVPCSGDGPSKGSLKCKVKWEKVGKLFFHKFKKELTLNKISILQLLSFTF